MKERVVGKVVDLLQTSARRRLPRAARVARLGLEGLPRARVGILPRELKPRLRHFRLVLAVENLPVFIMCFIIIFDFISINYLRLSHLREYGGDVDVDFRGALSHLADVTTFGAHFWVEI